VIARRQSTPAKRAAGRLGALGVRCLAMLQLLRKGVALIAIYSIALQSLLLSYAHVAHVGVDPFAVICASDSSGNHHGPLPQHGSDYDSCCLACGGSPVVVPEGAAFPLLWFVDLARPSALWVETVPSPAKHQPQASRAPPTSA
jgi:hypothetical protein